MAGRKGEETRVRIEAQALRLFAQKGVEATSMRDLAAAVGVAEAALYRHFVSKEAIGRSVFTRHYAALAQAIQEIGGRDLPFAARARALVEMFCALFDREPDVFTFLLIQQHSHLRHISDQPGENAVAALALIMADAFARGEIAESDPELAAAMALGAVVQPAVFKLYGRLPGPLSGRAAALARAALAAVDAR